MFTEICALATICSCGTRAPLRENNTYLTEPITAARGAAPRYPQRINRTEVGISLRRANHITSHPNKCALTANRRHASPRTQLQTAGRRSFLDLKNRRSRACASGAYSPYVRMAHERDRRFLWLKSDGNSPTLTKPRAHNPTIHAFRDRVHN